MTTPSKKDGPLYREYQVSRTDGRDAPGEKHEECEHFVLDLTHDKYAVPALQAYAAACEDEFPRLAHSIHRVVRRIKRRSLGENVPSLLEGDNISLQ